MKSHPGISLLADVSREMLGGEEFYPVKQKGQPRRLDPNWAGIAWLEATTLLDTEIEADSTDMVASDDGLTNYRASGWYDAVRRHHYSRPMLQILTDIGTTLTSGVIGACAACYDFSRSWACEEHEKPPGQPLKPVGLIATAQQGYIDLHTVDPNQGRPGYHYNMAQDRWVRNIYEWSSDGLGLQVRVEAGRHGD